MQHAIVGGTFLRWISHVFALSLRLPDYPRTHVSWQSNTDANQAVLCYQVLSVVLLPTYFLCLLPTAVMDYYDFAK